MLGGERLAYGLCRPPGHHATTSLYGGYCFFNNAAVAAAHIGATTGSRVAVLDVDYHHGNGTQQIFYERDDVAFVSLHGDPVRAYPYHTGHADETGAGRGRGSTCNVPLAAGTDDDAYLVALDRALAAVEAADAGRRRRVARRRHVRRGPDVRPRPEHRRASPAAAPPSPRSAVRWWCSRRAGTPTTPSAPTSPSWLTGAGAGVG